MSLNNLNVHRVETRCDSVLWPGKGLGYSQHRGQGGAWSRPEGMSQCGKRKEQSAVLFIIIHEE